MALVWREVFASCCSFPGSNTSFVQCLEELDYGKALGQLVSASQKLVMSKIPPEMKLVQFRVPFESLISSRSGLAKVANATLGIDCLLGGVIFSLIGTMSRSTPYLALCIQLQSWSFLMGWTRGLSEVDGASYASLVVSF